AGGGEHGVDGIAAGVGEVIAAMANPQREPEQRAKAVFERCVALDLAANVTDDSAKPRAQKLQFPPRAFELVGMCVAPHHDDGTLASAKIGIIRSHAPHRPTPGTAPIFVPPQPAPSLPAHSPPPCPISPAGS